MKTICPMQSIQVEKAASNPISVLFTPFHRIKSRLFAMWYGEKAIDANEPAKDTESNEATKVINHMKISKAYVTHEYHEHNVEKSYLDIIENCKDKFEDKYNLKNNIIFKNDNDKYKDEELEDYKEYEELENYNDDEEDIDEDEEDIDEYEDDIDEYEKMIDEKDVDENDKEYIILKNFVNNNILDKDKGPWDGPCDHMDLAVRLVKSVEQQKMYFPVPIDVLCLASYIFAKRQEMVYDEDDTMRLYRRRLRQAMRLRHAKDKKKCFIATWAAIELADFIDILRDCSRNNATSAKPASKETAR